MAQSFGNTWWGSYWLKSLTHIDYENRIPRGATYARNGSVKEIRINGNQITAKVAGSRPSPYKVSITIPSFSATQVEKLMNDIIARPALISKLLNRELDPEILSIAEKHGIQVFPRRWDDFKMSCNCPDWAVPCKHLAAVIYMVSREIDSNPFLVFEMHNINLIAELKKRGIEIEAKENMEIHKLGDFFVQKAKKDLTDTVPDFQRIDFARLQDISEPLISLLPPKPAFYNEGDFQMKYEVELLKVVKNARRIFSKALSAEAVFMVDRVPEALSHHSELSIEMDELMTGTLSYSNWQKESRKKTPVYGMRELLFALYSLPTDFLSDYQPSVAALHQALFCALHLLVNGAIVPQITQLANKKYAIRWLPAHIDPQVQHTMALLEKLMPDGTVKASVESPKKSVCLANQGECLVSFFLNQLIENLSRSVKGDLYLELFFKNQPYAFSKVGELETAGSIKAWLDRYFLSKRKHRPVFMVEETADERFSLHITIEDMEKPEADAVSLKKILTAPSYQKERFSILKELSLLSVLVEGLNDYINRNAATPIEFDGESFTPFLLKSIPAIRLLNIKIMLPKSLQQLLRPKATLRLTKKSGNEGSFIRLDDLLTFDWQVAVGDEVLSPDVFKKLLKKASGLIKFKQNYIYVDPADIEKLHKAFMETPNLSRAQLLQAALTEEFDAAPITLDDEVRKLIKELTTQSDIPLPKDINAKLRPYQERGYAWMYRNMRIGFGSIIADDMGLGKTLQVIVLLQKIKEEGGLDKEKALIVAPTGLLTNWQAEIGKFAPSLSAFIYHGTSRGIKQLEADVVLTTYGILRSDNALLKKMKWQVMVIDEAQNIKNQDTVQSKAARSIPAGVHIAMSGTPVENRLSEFWSIMDFANKGYLDTSKKFKSDYAQPIQLFNDKTVVARFRKITAPFMMRRLKSDKTIINDLPDKIEQNKFASLTRQQVALYEQTRQAAMNEIEGIEATDHQSLFKRQGLVLQMILALKQICNHPTQFLKNGDFNPELSGKTEMLLDLVEAIVESGEKVLIFTQFREMGEMLQGFLEKRLEERPMFYHGGCSLKERNEMVERFQNNRADKVFLLSLKAAGTGLNLTAASHVIHYDLWWNPAVEAQATDRAYRIGQHKNVMVHRFITKNTFEERIDEMIQKKKNLADLTVASGEGWIGKMSNKELREIFG